MAFVPEESRDRTKLASARAQDLGRRLKAEVEKFEAQYPGTSAEDIRAAAELALGSAGGTRPASRSTILLIRGVSIAVAVVGSLFATAAARGESTHLLFPMLLVAVIGGTAAILAMTWRYRKRSG